MSPQATSNTYIAAPSLVIAAQVAMHLGQPLLLTGEPGTGKTAFARYLAESLAPATLDSAAPLPLYGFETKSTSVSTDLFYRFDNLRRFHASHNPAMSADNRDYVSFEALGMAILSTRSAAEVADLLVNPRLHQGPLRSVVLIDEIDKAPRDFPNDILNEIDRMFFRIPELQSPGASVRQIEAAPALRPIVVITSNSEKNLPPAFLRRCIFHHIDFPDREHKRLLSDIIDANLVQGSASRMTREAIDFFYTLREDPSLEKAPATAELVKWVAALPTLSRRNGVGSDPGLADIDDVSFNASLGALVKSAEDMKRAHYHAAQRSQHKH